MYIPQPRGHKFLIFENPVLHRDFTSATLASFDVILLGCACPKPCLERTRRNCVNLTQFLPLLQKRASASRSQSGTMSANLMASETGSSYPQQRETERSRRGTPCCTYLCRMWIFQGASAGAHPIFVSSWLGIRQNAFTGSFSPWLHRGWFCAVPPSGRTIPPLQGRREQRRHWFWYPVRRSFPCPQRTA